MTMLYELRIAELTAAEQLARLERERRRNELRYRRLSPKARAELGRKRARQRLAFALFDAERAERYRRLEAEGKLR